MEKIKRLVFLSAIVVALVMFTSCSEKHKKYIPADSKVVGKIDVKAFIDQTDVDTDKLMEDIEEYLGEDAASIKEMGIDVKDPIYIFGRGKGSNFTFGAVAKVDDQEKVKAWFEDNAKLEIDKEGDGFDYFAEGNSAIAVNGDALVIIMATAGDAKKEIKKIMGQEYEGDLGDNNLFEKVCDSKSFACLYADMSIIPKEVMEMAESQAPQLKETFGDMRKMILGIDGTCSDGICDFEYWADSEDDDVKEKIDNMKEMFREIDEKAVETIPEDALAGIAANIDGPKCSKFINTTLKDVDLLDQIPSEFREIYDAYLKIIGDIDGNFAGYFAAPLDIMFAVESKDNTAQRIAELIQNLDTPSFASFSDEPEFIEDDTAVDEDFDEEVVEEEEDDDFGYDYGRPSSTIVERGDGFCYNDGSGTQFWFGNKNGALYFTSKESLISSVYKKADKPISSEMVSFATSRRCVYFLNVDKAKDFSSGLDKETKKVFNAFEEVISKIKFLTFSMK
ncbi:MAG: DUF4836 family protein [Muribaculaceae bacterium]|nr:DUF4836 family protein [Muribaculaceae bacterium]